MPRFTFRLTTLCWTHAGWLIYWLLISFESPLVWPLGAAHFCDCRSFNVVLSMLNEDSGDDDTNQIKLRFIVQLLRTSANLPFNVRMSADLPLLSK